MQPEINVFGLSIKTFGLFFALNFVAWGALVSRRLREIGKPVDWAYEMVAAALVGGLIGARGYWLLQNHEAFSLGNALGGSGLIWYGGLAGRRRVRAAVGALARLPLAGAVRHGRTRAWRSATPSGGSDARSPATATTAGPGTDRGRWAIPTAPCPPRRA